MANIINFSDFNSITNNTPSNVYNIGSTAVDLAKFIEDNGYKTDGNITYLPNTTQVNGNNISGNTLVEVSENTTDNTINFTPKQGSLVTKVAPMTVVLPILTGCGIGYESYKEYPEFWSSLSNALFNDPSLLLNPTSKEMIDVIVSATEEQTIKCFVDKKIAEEVIRKANECRAFVGRSGSYRPSYGDTGEYVLTGGGMATPQAIYELLGKPQTVNIDAIQRITDNINYVQSQTGRVADSVLWHVYQNSDGLLDYEAYLFDIGAYSSYNITRTAENVPQIELNKSQLACLGYVSFSLTYTVAHQIWITSTNNVGLKTRDIARVGWVSTVGADYLAPVDGILYNDENELPQDMDNPIGAYVGWLSGVMNLPFVDPQTGGLATTEMLPLQLQDILNNPSLQPSPSTQADAQTGDVPVEVTEPLPQYISDPLKPTIETPNIGRPSENPSGNTPIIIPPTNNNSSKLFTVYNPNGTQLDNLGGYLWSDNIATLIKELFANNRMDAIISLHQVYCTPSTTTPHNIILGNLDSGVSAKVVNNQYVNIDCGTQYISEMYGDARDYLNVDCQVYLPFIGFRNIDPHDAVNCSIKILYTIDVYTGSCLAQLVINKGAYNQTLYTFEGNCSIQIPLTGSDRARIIGAIASTVATGISTGGVGMASMAMGQIASGGAQSSIQRTSGFSGNCGAMAIKKPYIVISRMKTADAIDYNKIVGNPTNKTVYLNNYRGFTRVKEIHLDNLKCTDEEKRLIYNALKQGIVL